MGVMNLLPGCLSRDPPAHGALAHHLLVTPYGRACGFVGFVGGVFATW